MRKVTYIRAPKDLSPQLKGLYERVARQLGVDPSHVSQIARGESQSALVVDALRHELTQIFEQGAKAPFRHEVQFYSDDMVLLDRLVPFVAAALKRGDAAIIVATESHRDSLVHRLKSEHIDIDTAIKTGMYVSVDAAGTLSIFMVNDMPESARFLKVVGGFIEEAAKRGKTEHRRVAVFGEWVSLLWKQGNVDAAIRLEQLGNQLAITHDIDILCGYEMSSTERGQDDHDFKSICAEHSAIYFQGK
jgi:transcriptional regulator with XRE-family HTH domain